MKTAILQAMFRQSWVKTDSILGTTTPDFKLDYTTQKQKQYQHKNRCRNQCGGTENPEIHPCTHSHFIFEKGVKNHTLEKKEHLQQMFLGGSQICKQKEDPSLSFLNNNNKKKKSKYIKNLNV